MAGRWVSETLSRPEHGATMHIMSDKQMVLEMVRGRPESAKIEGISEHIAMLAEIRRRKGAAMAFRVIWSAAAALRDAAEPIAKPRWPPAG